MSFHIPMKQLAPGEKESNGTLADQGLDPATATEQDCVAAIREIILHNVDGANRLDAYVSGSGYKFEIDIFKVSDHIRYRFCWPRYAADPFQGDLSPIIIINNLSNFHPMEKATGFWQKYYNGLRTEYLKEKFVELKEQKEVKIELPCPAETIPELAAYINMYAKRTSHRLLEKISDIQRSSPAL